MADLKRKLKTAQDNHEKALAQQKEQVGKMIAEGSTLYEDIRKGGNRSKWYKYEYACFFEFYKTISPETMNMLDKTDMHVTNTLKLLAILMEMELDDERICSVMGIKKNSLNTMKRRLK